MKLKDLKKLLEERENQLSVNKRRTSSVREEYKYKLKERNTYQDVPIIQNHDKVLKEPTRYSQSNELGLFVNKKDELPSINDNLYQDSFEEVDDKLDKIKIIGITGSRGKSTTAFLVHEYLKSLGKKSILYSSIRIDSPVSYVNANEPCEIPIQNERTLLDIIEEAEAYEADYIVMEINERTIQRGLADNIPFTVRALTNLDGNHNLEQYSPEEYIRIKESFFENINDDCTCVFGLTGALSRDDFNRLLRLNNNPKVTFGSKYICEVRNADYTNLDCLLYEMDNTLDGLNIKVRIKDKSYNFKTNIILPHNSLNITCAIAIAEALGIFDANLFNKCISNIKVPGREEVIKVNGRTIIIGLSLIPALESFKIYKQNAEINAIKVVVGSIGSGFANWSKEFPSELNQKISRRKYAMNYLKNNADYAYLTSNDNAAEDPLSIARELQSYLDNFPSQIIVDRAEAIRRAIIESKEKDLIYIAGRGNRRVFCDSRDTVKLFKDKDIVNEVLKGLGW